MAQNDPRSLRFILFLFHHSQVAPGDDLLTAYIKPKALSLNDQS